MSTKTLIYNHHGYDDIEKAAIALTLANMACSRRDETFMFLTCDAVHLATKGHHDTRRVAGYESVDDLIERFRENGGKIWVYRACAVARGLGPEDFEDDAVLVDETTALEFVDHGGRVLM